MFNSSYLARRLVRSRQLVLGQSQRAMSALLVPLAPRDQLPFEVRTTEKTDAEIAVLEKEFKEFNARCSEELKEMNQNRITNIIERGGVDGWETAADLAHLKKSFSFTSTLQAQYFVQNVGRFCAQQDHHPEWSVSEGGRTVNVTLTSHFARNKVTLFDFQLAEHMNQQYAITQKWYRQYPFIASKTLVSWQVLIVGFVAFNFLVSIGVKWGNIYPTSSSRGLGPQAIHNRPLIAAPFEIATGAVRGQRNVEVYAMANVDDYAFKTNTFSADKLI